MAHRNRGLPIENGGSFHVELLNNQMVIIISPLRIAMLRVYCSIFRDTQRSLTRAKKNPGLHSQAMILSGYEPWETKPWEIIGTRPWFECSYDITRCWKLFKMRNLSFRQQTESRLSWVLEGCVPPENATDIHGRSPNSVGKKTNSAGWFQATWKHSFWWSLGDHLMVENGKYPLVIYHYIP